MWYSYIGFLSIYHPLTDVKNIWYSACREGGDKGGRLIEQQQMQGCSSIPRLYHILKLVLRTAVTPVRHCCILVHLMIEQMCTLCLVSTFDLGWPWTVLVPGHQNCRSNIAKYRYRQHWTDSEFASMLSYTSGLPVVLKFLIFLKF